MEWAYTSNFFTIMQEQINKGDFLRASGSWLLISFVYLGSIQGVLITATLGKAIR